jgi:hypothetical protein
MSVTNQTPIGAAIGNGVTTAFPFTYYIAAASDLVVKLDGVTLTLGANYTVTGAGNPSGGTITMTVAPAIGARLSHFRDTSLTRATDYQDGGDLLAPVLNSDFDRLWLALQEIFSGGKGAPTAVRVPAGEVVAELPAAAARANRLLGFGPSGELLPQLPTAGDATALAVDLANNATGKGAALVGFDQGATYAAGTTGAALKSAASILTALGASGGSALVGFVQSGAGASSRTAQAKLRETVSAADFGAATGATGASNVAAILAAVAALPAQGGQVVIPAGVFDVAGPIAITKANVRISGAGRKATVLRQTTVSAKTFVVTAAYFTLESISIEYSAQGTAGGNAVSIDNCFYSTIDDVYVYRAAIGFEYRNGANSHQLTKFVVEDATNVGVLVENAVNLMASTFQILNSNTTLCSIGCIRLFGATEGCNFFNGHTFRGAFALVTDAASYTFGSRPAYNKFHAVYFDASANGALIDKSTEFDFTDCWFSTRPGNGAYVVQTDGIRFTGGGAINCDLRGVLVEATAKRVVFKNFAVRGNSVSAANTFDGIVFAPNTTDFIVQGCTFTNSVVTFGTQRYGVAVNAGTSDRYVIADNLVSGNGTGGVFDGGSGVNKRVANNY